MKIEGLEIRNFRSIDSIKIDCKELTPICGANSSGKSNVLRALRFAFLHEYDPVRVARNFPSFVLGPSAQIRIKLVFDQPTSAVQDLLDVPDAHPFEYEVRLKRNGTSQFLINGKSLSKQIRDQFIDQILIVYIPPIRDIAYDGLAPFKEMLSKALRKAKKGKSFASLNSSVKDAVETKGQEVLSRSADLSGAHGSKWNLSVDASSLDVELLLTSASVQVDLGSSKIPLEMIGTGHQSQVVMSMFKQVGSSFSGLAIYVFEEPDNHLHPTAMRSVGQDLIDLSKTEGAQVFVNSHSPLLLNQFEIRDVRALRIENGKSRQLTQTWSKSDREIRVLLGQFGIRPIEAMLARLVFLVEGPSDVTIVRAMFQKWFSAEPDRLDVLVVQCGGKGAVLELSRLLKEMGAEFLVMLDFDAAIKDNIPYFAPGMTSHSATLIAHIDELVSQMYMPSAGKPKAIKTLEAMKSELQVGPPPSGVFLGSVLDKLIRSGGRLSASQLSQVSAAITAWKPSKWLEVLWDANVWLWSWDPEHLLVSSPASRSLVEAELRSAGLIPSSVASGSCSQEYLARQLHGLAHDPQLLGAIVEGVLGLSAIGTNQFARLRTKLAERVEI